MSHEIDLSNQRANIAFVGEEPWHGLGQRLSPGAPIATWQREAGMQWEAIKAPVLYQNGETHTFNGRNVLFRNDTGAPLSIVSDDYRIVQPQAVIDFFAKLCEIGGFEMETAGCLNGGRRIWALAKVGEGADIVNGDRVRPYILLATSYDATMATTGKFTNIRVVCKNTMNMAVPQSDFYGRTRGGEAGDQEEGPLTNMIRLPHSKEFDPEKMRLQLGIVANAWERFQVQAGMLAAQPFGDLQADEFVRELLLPYVEVAKRDADSIRAFRGYQKIMHLFRGGAMGAELAGPTKWGMLNAVTEYVDHSRGRSTNSRLEQAWFGTGNAIKDRAMALLSNEKKQADKIAA